MSEALVGQIQGFLRALEGLNTYVDHVSLYEFIELDGAADTKRALQQHFEQSSLEVDAVELADWEARLNEGLRDWFFVWPKLPPVPMVTPEAYHQALRDVNESVTELVPSFIQCLRDLLGPDVRAWGLDLRLSKDAQETIDRWNAAYGKLVEQESKGDRLEENERQRLFENRPAVAQWVDQSAFAFAVADRLFLLTLAWSD